MFNDTQFQVAYGPPTHFEPGGPQLELFGLRKGGLVNSSESAVDYAVALMENDPSTALIPKAALSAMERGGTWHISARNPKGLNTEILAFSREDGLLLSSDSP